MHIHMNTQRDTHIYMHIYMNTRVHNVGKSTLGMTHKISTI